MRTHRLSGNAFFLSLLLLRGREKLGEHRQATMNPTPLSAAPTTNHSSVMPYQKCGRKAAQLARILGVSAWYLRDCKRLYGTGATIACLPLARRAQRSLLVSWRRSCLMSAFLLMVLRGWRAAHADRLLA